MQGNGNNGFHVKEMALRTPPVSAMEALRRSMANAVAGAVTERDMDEIVKRLKEDAKNGDKKAMALFFKLVLGDGKEPKEEKEPKGMSAVAEAIRDLVDEVRIAKAPPPRSLPRGKRDDDEDDED